MYIYNVCISTFQFLTFWFTARENKEFKCIFKFLSMLFSAASVVYSIRIWWNLFCCSILRNTKKNLHSQFFLSYISIIVVIALEGNKCFQSYILEGIRAKTFWYFFFCRLFFLYLVISCFLNWFLFSCCFHLLWHIMASTNTCAVPVSYMNKLQIFFSSIQSYEKLRLMKKKWKWIKVGL